MIVRISGEGQFRLADGDSERLNELEAELTDIVEGGREADFPPAFSAVLDFVRSSGEVVGDDELDSSDVILPPSDISFAEAGTEFTGEGLIPD